MLLNIVVSYDFIYYLNNFGGKDTHVVVVVLLLLTTAFIKYLIYYITLNTLFFINVWYGNYIRTVFVVRHYDLQRFNILFSFPVYSSIRECSHIS